MQERELEIINKLGLHARAAAKFVTLASSFQSDIKVSHKGREVSGKSIMGVMMLAAAKGCRIMVKAEGEDEAPALEALQNLLARRFDEEQ